MDDSSRDTRSSLNGPDDYSSRLLSALKEIPGLNSAVADTIASGALDLEQPAQVAETLLRAILRQAQLVVNAFCPQSLCSVKLLRTKRNTFESYFPAGLPQELVPFTDRLCEVPRNQSYSGLAFDHDTEFIVPDILSDDTIHPFSFETRKVIAESGVRGLVVWPIRIMHHDEWRPVAVFKVDCFGECIRDNEETRILFEVLAEHFAVTIQFTLLLNRDWTLEQLLDHDLAGN